MSIKSNDTSEKLIISEYEKHEFEVETNPKSSKKMEDILISLHSYSARTQQILLFFLSALHFALGMHIFTYVYMFITPTFYMKDNPTKGKTLKTRIFLIFWILFDSKQFRNTRLAVLRTSS